MENTYSKKIFTLILLSLFLLSSISLLMSQETDTQKIPQAVSHFKNFNASYGEQWRIHWDKKTGLPRMIWGSKTKQYFGTPAEIANEFVRENKPFFAPNLKEAESDVITFRVLSIKKGLSDKQTVTLQQQYHGLNVYNAQITLLINQDGSISHITNSTWPVISVDTKPTLSPDEAISKLMDIDKEKRGTKIETSPELIIYPGALSKLAYRIQCSFERSLDAWEYIIDANNGVIIRTTKLSLE